MAIDSEQRLCRQNLEPVALGDLQRPLFCLERLVALEVVPRRLCWVLRQSKAQACPLGIPKAR
jgi:hypothetical protein